MSKRRIEYEIGTSIDTAGIDELKRQLASIRLDIKAKEGTDRLTDDLKQAYDAASELEEVLNRSWNAKLGQLDLSKLRKEIDNSFTSMQNLKSLMEKGDVAGTMAFNSLSKAILNTNVYLKQSSKLLDEMAVSLKNTVKWGITSSLFNNLTGSLQKAWDYSVNLDKSLNDIRIVADKSADEMERFAKNANKAAKNLGASTKDYAQAALIYYQQGDSDAEAQAKADVTLKTANVTGQSGQEVSEQLTAVWNGYKVSAAEAELYIDKLAAVAASTASDLEELATGMSKVASAANIMGVDVDQLNATLATVVSVTRQAPESVGTAFKTIYARMGDIEAGLDAETTLGSYTEQMQAIAGINVLDANGQLRDMGEVIEEVGDMWGNLSREQQVALSQVMAGTRQYNNLLALFDNWDMYTDALNTSAGAAGELQRQQDIYMESTEAHLQRLSTEAEKTYDILFDTNSVNNMTDALTGLLGIVNTYLRSFGGGLKSISGVALTLANIFSNQLGGELDRVAKNWQSIGQTKDAEKLKETIKSTYEKEGHSISDESLNYAIESQQRLLEISKTLSEEEQKEYINRQKEIVQLQEKVEAATSYERIAKNISTMGIDSFKGLSTGDINLDEFEDAVDKISDNIEDMIKIKEELSGKGYTAITKEDVQNRLAKATADYKKDDPNKKGSNREMRKLKKDLEEYGEAEAQQISIETLQLNKQLTAHKKQLEAKKATIALSEDEVKILSIITKYEENGTMVEEDRNKLVEFQNQKINEQRMLLDQAKKGAEGLRIAQENSTPELLDNIDKMKRYQESVYEAKLEQEKLATSVQGLTAIGSVITTITGTFSTLTDETASAEEKINTLLMGMLSAGVMVLSNWQSISKIGPGLVVMMNSATVALGGTTAGVTTLSGAFTTLAGTIWAALAPILPIVLAVAAAVIALVAVFAVAIKSYNAEADAAKEAAEAAKMAADAAAEAKAAYDNLFNGLEKYKEGVKALEELTAGTQEYKDALDSANQAVMDLVKADASLAKYVKKRGELYVFEDENGKDMTDEILKQAKAKMHSSEATANMAQIYANETSLQSQRRQSLRDAGLSRKDEVTSALVALSTGNLPAAVYQAGNAAFNSLTDEQLQTVLQTITDNYGTLTRENLEKLSFLNESEIDALMDNKTSLEQLAKSTDDLNATNKLLVGETMANALENNSIIQNAKTTNDEGEEVALGDKHKNAISALYSEGYTKEQQDAARKKLKEQWYKDKAFGGGNEDAVHAEYAKIMGYTLSKDKVGDKAVFIDKDGKEITVSDDAQRAHIVNTKLAEQIDDYDSNNLQTITNAVSSVNTTEFDKKYGINLDDAFLDAVASGGDFDFSSMFADISPSELEEMSNLSAEDWQSALGLTDEELKTLGFDSSEDLLKSIEEGFKGYEWDPDAALSKVINRTDNAADLEDKGLDPTEVKEYAKHLMTASDESDKLADSLGEDADAAYIVAKGVMRMNNGVEKLSENFDEWSDVLKKSDKSSEEYHEALSGMQDAVSDLLDTEDEYVTDSFIQEHMEDIEKAANGDAEAIDRLHKELAKDMVFNIATDADMTQAEIDALVARVENLEIPDIEAGVKLDGTDEYAQELMKIVQDSKMTAEQAKAFFGQMGFDAQFETHKETINQTVPVTKTDTEVESIFPLKMTSRTYQDGYQTISQEVDVPSLSTEDGKPPKVTLTKKADGSMNNASKINKGGKGSGSGSKAKNEAKVKDEKDIYHDINIELKQISNSLGKIQKEQEGLVGKDLIENLAEQYALLNRQLDATAEKIRIAEGEAGGLREKLEAKGVKFNEDGTIANYADAYDKQLAKLNATIEKYNKMSPEQQEKYQKTLDKAKEEWEQFLENISRYDEILTDEIPGMMSEIQDTLNEQIEIKLQAFEYEVKIRLDLAEAKKEWNEFKADILEGKDLDNDPLAAARVNKQNMDALYNSEGTGSLQATTAHIGKIMEQLAQMDADQVAGIYGETYTYKNSKGEDVTIDYNNRKKALEDLKTYIDENIGGLTEFNELMGDIYGNYVDLLGKIQEGFDKQTEAFETLDSMIQHDMELIKMAYGEEAYDKLSELYDKDLENSKTKLAALSAQVDYWKKEVVDQRAYVDTLEEGTDEWFRATEALTAAEESLNGAIDAESQAVLDAMQKVTDKLLFNIDKVFSELNKSLTDGLGLEYASMEWELIGKSADEYLDTVNAIYSTQQLQNKYLDAIEKSSNPAHQKKLNDLMEQETKYLREQDKLSQYDLDRANLKYELALKQIALEEAQQNKSKLRLRRDSQGNYTYQYTADDDQVASVQQEINDLYNQLYNLDAEEYRGNLEKIYDVWAEAQEKMKEAAQINDPKVRAEYEQKITEEYGALINGLVEKNENLKSNLYQSTMSQLLELYNTDTANYEQMTEEQKAILDEYITAETELNGAAFDNMFGLYNKNIVNLQSMADGQKNILMTSIVPQWDSAYQKMTDVIVGEGGFENTLKVAFEQISNMAKTAFEELAKYETEYREKSDDNKNYIQDQLTSAEKLLKMYQDDLPEIKTLIAGLAAAWDEVTTAIGNATTAANNYYTTTQENNADEGKDEDVEPTNEEGGKEDSGSGGNKDTGSGGNTGTNTNLASNGAPFIATHKVVSGDTLSGIGARYGVDWKRIYAENKKVIGSNPNLIKPGQKLKIPKYASGGYTGDWAGNGGQLAMLHKKELVLNAHDTENMLDAITILRDITSNLGATLLNRMASINAGGIGALGAAGTAAGLEQMVTINAEFPNVTNSHEIEDAINNLVNRASQHIHKN